MISTVVAQRAGGKTVPTMLSIQTNVTVIVMLLFHVNPLKVSSVTRLKHLSIRGTVSAAYHSNCTDGELRVVNVGLREASGRLEICDNSVWFSVYRSNSWTSSSRPTRGFACRSLGYGHAGTHAILKSINMHTLCISCLLYTSPSPRDATLSRMPSSA